MKDVKIIEQLRCAVHHGMHKGHNGSVLLIRKGNSMLRVGRRTRFIQVATALLLVLAFMLPFMPTAAQASSGGCDAWHKVRAGESLGSIANMYRTTATALARANHLSNPSIVVVGQHLCIVGQGSNHTGSAWAQPYKHHDDKPDWDKPGDDYGHHGCIYVVRKGDTLSEIAKWNHISVHKLAWMNHIENPSLIRVGQKINVCK